MDGTTDQSSTSGEGYLCRLRYYVMGDITLRETIGMWLVKVGAPMYLGSIAASAEATAPRGLRVRIDRHAEKVGRFE